MKPFYRILAVLWLGLAAIFGSVYLASAGSMEQSVENGQAVFNQKCSSCHSIGGGKLVGPDLAGVTTRRSPEWLKAFIADPPAMFASDPDAAALLAEYNNLPMPDMGLPESEIVDVLAYIESGGAAPPADQNPSVPAAAAGPVLYSGSTAIGQQLFTGEMALANGGAPCISCHTVGGVGMLEGGKLGPDLTHVYTRYGEQGLVNVLATVNFPTMLGSFGTRPILVAEQANLVAFFKEADQKAPPPYWGLTGLFLGLGTAGALALFGLLLFFWPRQRQSLSDRLRKTSRF